MLCELLRIVPHKSEALSGVSSYDDDCCCSTCGILNVSPTLFCGLESHLSGNDICHFHPWSLVSLLTVRVPLTAVLTRPRCCCPVPAPLSRSCSLWAPCHFFLKFLAGGKEVLTPTPSTLNPGLAFSVSYNTLVLKQYLLVLTCLFFCSYLCKIPWASAGKR